MAQTAILPNSLPDAPHSKREDWLTIMLVGLAHGSSHFFQLVLPSLYVSLAAAFDLDFARLGMLASIFFVVSGLCQVASGFVVDKVGGRTALWFGISLFALSAALIALSNGYSMLVIAAVIGGLGNAVFHPADFYILNHRISPSRLGHAFSTHNLTGTLGWALAPVFVASITLAFGWQAAAWSVMVLMLVILALTVGGRRLLDAGQAADAAVHVTQPVANPSVQSSSIPNASNQAPSRAIPGQPVASASSGHAPAPAAPNVLVTLLTSPALLGAFLFFCCLTISLSAVQNYTIPILSGLYGFSVMTASTALSFYLIGQACGLIAGGFLVSPTMRSESIVFGSLVMAALFIFVLAMGWIPVSLAVPVVGLAGFCSGMSGPSRDMLVRRVTPKKSVGSVYGLVYSGLDVGSALGPLLFGVMLDAGWSHGPWFGATASFIAGALIATYIGRVASRTPAAA